ncbi:Helix-turn-helix domain-containing protein [Natronoarchaeum philippinense]|uniref:Helix-turn-helix domain-containing protein n=1 Tax=Natronoarchaeum philippinense TaxID=558529 RepID=A0A285NU27_NATPI|nr:helix-turn-helix domain-containing protein [Natronoarchaeum philippinense]SNZ12537.1 Helix-turn-helix domain-containing protein [Natronoarchaeum philippinense]
MGEQTIEVDQERAASAFGALADPSRIGILLALWQSGPLAFADLHRETAIEDSGRFNYHLDRLVDQFVIKTEDTYRLTPVGAKVADILLDARFGPTPPPIDEPTDADCPDCGERIHARYENGDIRLQCSACDLLVHYGYFPPRGRTTRDADGFLDAYSQRLWRDFSLAHRGVCPHCSGRMRNRIDEDPDWYPDYAAKSICRDCGVSVGSTLGLRLLGDPDVVAFLADHDVHADDNRFWTLEFCLDDSDVRVVSDPVRRYVIPISTDSETLEVIVDETASVVETARWSHR